MVFCFSHKLPFESLIMGLARDSKPIAGYDFAERFFACRMADYVGA
jgi:hypothetical protein